MVVVDLAEFILVDVSVGCSSSAGTELEVLANVLFEIKRVGSSLTTIIINTTHLS